jgi:hypothetical protein
MHVIFLSFRQVSGTFEPLYLLGFSGILGIATTPYGAANLPNVRGRGKAREPEVLRESVLSETPIKMAQRGRAHREGMLDLQNRQDARLLQ